MSDLLSGGFAALRHNPRTMLGLSACVYGVALLLLLVGEVATITLAGTALRDTPDLSSSGVQFLVGLASPVLAAVLVQPVLAAVRGERPRLGQTWREVRGRIPATLGLMALSTIALIVAVAPFVGVVAYAVLGAQGSEQMVTVVLVALLVGLLLVVALWVVSIYLTFAYAVVVAERLGPFAAIARSFRLVRGAFWRTLGVRLLTSIVVGLASTTLMFPVMIALVVGLAAGGADGGTGDGTMTIVSTGVMTALQLLIAAFVEPFSAAVITLMYVDRRIRSEGYALELMGGAPVAPR